MRQLVYSVTYSVVTISSSLLIITNIHFLHKYTTYFHYVFVKMYTCIYCILYCFIYVYLFILICFVCASVRNTAAE
jgi:hypothetical protein